MTRFVGLAVGAIVATMGLSACSVAGHAEPVPTTTSACAEATATVNRLLAELKDMSDQGSTQSQTSEYRLTLGTSLQVIVGHPACFSVETVGQAQQLLADLNKPNVTVEQPGFFDNWRQP